MEEDKIIKHFDTILLADKKDNNFNINNFLYKVIPDSQELSEMWHEIKEFSEFHGYFEFYENQNCKLTSKGLKAKSKGGHLQLLEYENLKEKKQDELLDLDVTLKRFESKIGKKLLIAGFIITFLSLLTSVLTVEFWPADDNKNEQRNQVENPLSSKKQEIQKDSLN